MWPRLPGSWTQDPGSKIRDPGSWMLDPGSCMSDPGSWIPDSASTILGAGSWILDRGSTIQGPGSVRQRHYTYMDICVCVYILLPSTADDMHIESQRSCGDLASNLVLLQPLWGLRRRVCEQCIYAFLYVHAYTYMSLSLYICVRVCALYIYIY